MHLYVWHYCTRIGKRKQQQHHKQPSHWTLHKPHFFVCVYLRNDDKQTKNRMDLRICEKCSAYTSADRTKKYFFFEFIGDYTKYNNCLAELMSPVVFAVIGLKQKSAAIVHGESFPYTDNFCLRTYNWLMTGPFPGSLAGYPCMHTRGEIIHLLLFKKRQKIFPGKQSWRWNQKLQKAILSDTRAGNSQWRWLIEAWWICCCCACQSTPTASAVASLGSCNVKKNN